METAPDRLKLSGAVLASAVEQGEDQAHVFGDQLALLEPLAAVAGERLGADGHVADARRVAGEGHAHLDEDRALALEAAQGLAAGARHRIAGVTPLVLIDADAEAADAGAEHGAEAAEGALGDLERRRSAFANCDGILLLKSALVFSPYSIFQSAQVEADLLHDARIYPTRLFFLRTEDAE